MYEIPTNPKRELTAEETAELSRLDALYYSQPFMSEEDSLRRIELFRIKQAATKNPAQLEAYIFLVGLMMKSEA